jgi:cephalosporin-C deacetylase-like acetyl esterase
MIELMGGFPEKKVPLRPKIIESVKKKKYIRHKVIYNTRKGLQAVAYLLIPRGIKGKTPAVLCPHGHFERGKKSVASDTNNGYGRILAEEGYITLCPDNIGFAERGFDAGWMTSRYMMLAYRLRLMGEDVMGFRVWDLVRALDYLESLPEVDNNRIGCVGLSLGGQLTMFISALDDRIKAVGISGFMPSSSGFMNTLEYGWVCPCGFLTGFLKYADFSDVFSLIAPRPLMIENGYRDIATTLKDTFNNIRKIKKAYQFFNAPDNLVFHMFKGGHEFNGKQIIPRIKNRL